MAEVDSEVVVVEDAEVSPHPDFSLFHPLMGLTKVVVGRRFHLV